MTLIVAVWTAVLVRIAAKHDYKLKGDMGCLLVLAMAADVVFVCALVLLWVLR